MSKKDWSKDPRSKEERIRIARDHHNANADKKYFANERNKERASRSPQDQVKVLDERLGKNEGAHKERIRLFKQIQAAQPQKQNNE